MGQRINNQTGVTLIEVIIGALIIAFISVAGWTAVSVMTRGGEMARNRITAVNLLQQSQEEVRRLAQVETVFDTLENCDFPPDQAPKSSCGLTNLTTSVEFEGFDRSLNVSSADGGSELKRALVTVTWEEQGRVQQQESLIFLSRPPQPLAGNLKGLVCSEENDTLALDGIRVELDAIASTAAYSTTSVGFVDADGANYSFADFDSGRFILPSGAYTLSVDDSRFFPYTHPDPVVVPSNAETVVNFCLEPKPDQATIFGEVIDQGTGGRISTFTRAQVNLYQNGSRRQRVTNRNNYSFEVDFADSNPQYFTLNTTEAFRLGYAYRVDSGGVPSCQFQYNREGHSTAVVQDDLSLMCSHPYNGNASSDQIEVFPGDNVRVDLSVTPVPELTIKGRVMDSNGQPVDNATIRARWPRSDRSRDWRKGTDLQTARTDNNGDFTFSVPAVQALFPNVNANNHYLQVWARGRVNVMTCCDIVQGVNRNSQTSFVGPLWPGDPPRDIGALIIPAKDEDCGDVSGTVISDATGNAIFGANVDIAVEVNTDVTGDYAIVCPEGQSGYRLPTADYRFIARHPGYYTNDSRGNDQYVRRGPGGRDVSIITDTLMEYDARLWPRGFADVTIEVYDQTTGQPLDGVPVVFQLYSGSDITQITSGGIAVFNGVPETWPPQGLPADDYYRNGEQSHTINISYDPANYQPHIETVSELRDGEKRLITVFLRANGGV